MDIGAIFLLLGLLLLVALFVIRPFMERTPRVLNEGHEVSTLLADSDRILNALQELDFDQSLGKIPAEDYLPQRTALLQKGSDVLHKLDTLQAQPDAGDAENRIEAAIAARREGAAAVHPETDDDIEELIAKRRAARKEKSAGFCPKCGKPILASDRFCPSCGKPLV